jgi:3-ketoacyl-CoA synthase
LLLFTQKFTPENVEFQAKILARSGLGEETNLPPGLITVPPSISMADARLEFQQVRDHKAGSSSSSSSGH